MSSSPGTNQSVERAAAVLSAFVSGGRHELRVSDVAAMTRLGQSTASRLLATLEGLDLVERDAASNLYRLGTQLITLGGAAINQHPIHRAARQRAQQLAASLGLGANVAVRRDAAVFYLCNFEGRLSPKSFVLTGQRNPLHATALGKCLLQVLAADDRRSLLPELPQFTSRTIGDHDDLDAELAADRQRGYAREVDELAIGRACLAAPIYGVAGEVVASLSVSGALSAMNLEEQEQLLARTVIEAADAVSIELGYHGPLHIGAAALQH